MARTYHNIELLPGKSHLTGYGKGTVWAIRKRGKVWCAASRDGAHYLYTGRLAELSTWLTEPGL